MQNVFAQIMHNISDTVASFNFSFVNLQVHVISTMVAQLRTRTLTYELFGLYLIGFLAEVSVVFPQSQTDNLGPDELRPGGVWGTEGRVVGLRDRRVGRGLPADGRGGVRRVGDKVCRQAGAHVGWCWRETEGKKSEILLRCFYP